MQSHAATASGTHEQASDSISFEVKICARDSARALAAPPAAAGIGRSISSASTSLTSVSVSSEHRPDDDVGGGTADGGACGEPLEEVIVAYEAIDPGGDVRRCGSGGEGPIHASGTCIGASTIGVGDAAPAVVR